MAIVRLLIDDVLNRAIGKGLRFLDQLQLAVKAEDLFEIGNTFRCFILSYTVLLRSQISKPYRTNAKLYTDVVFYTTSPMSMRDAVVCKACHGPSHAYDSTKCMVCGLSHTARGAFQHSGITPRGWKLMSWRWRLGVLVASMDGNLYCSLRGVVRLMPSI